MAEEELLLHEAVKGGGVSQDTEYRDMAAPAWGECAPVGPDKSYIFLICAARSIDCRCCVNRSTGDGRCVSCAREGLSRGSGGAMLVLSARNEATNRNGDNPPANILIASLRALVSVAPPLSLKDPSIEEFGTCIEAMSMRFVRKRVGMEECMDRGPMTGKGAFKEMRKALVRTCI